MKLILAVTACPTGIAHTYIAAEMLQKAAKAAGAEIKVETNGSIGVENALTESDIKKAMAIIVAADARIEMERFDGKALKETSISDVMKNADKLVKEALEGKFDKYSAY